MKTFISTISLQTKRDGNYVGLSKSIYEARDNEKLSYEREISFPILSAINGYVNIGETIKILVLKQLGEGTHDNYDIFKEQLDDLCKEKNITYQEEVIGIVFDETAATHLRSFMNIIEKINDGDILYACLTYGTKPIPVVQMMALNFAYRSLTGVQIGCIVYGQKVWSENKTYIFDITSLFSMDEIVHTNANLHISDPKQHIRNVLEVLDDFEEDNTDD